VEMVAPRRRLDSGGEKDGHDATYTKKLLKSGSNWFQKNQRGGISCELKKKHFIYFFTAKILERMINQNTYEDIAQDYRYRL
jgi:hypothetical protein